MTDTVSFILLDDLPAQNYVLAINGVDYNHTFQYNPMRGGFWTIGLSLIGADCPLIAGRRLENGINVYGDISRTDMLMPLRRPDISVGGEDTYRQFVKPLSDGLPAFMLVRGTRLAFNNLFFRPKKIVC
jgi:hypothetical protein